MTGLTVGDVRKTLEGLPDDMLVGVTDHFGDFQEMYCAPEVKSKLHTAFGRKKIGKDLKLGSVKLS